MLDEQKSNTQISGASNYFIPYILVRASVKQNNKKILYPLNGKLVRVEEYASHLFQKSGWTVYRGDDVHFFFSFLSCNFKKSFFYEVCKNWVGPTAKNRIDKLDSMVIQCIANNVLVSKIIDEAEELLFMYYSSYRPKQTIFTDLVHCIRSFDQNLLLRIIRFYRATGYITKGAPDLFITKENHFKFVEVKSHTDSLSSAQYEYFEGYLLNVSDNIVVLRVVPELTN